jgi:hypothetical protein
MPESSSRKTPGYVGRRLAFMIIWVFVTMFPSGSAVNVSETYSPGTLFILGVITLAIVLVPPIIAARQIYRAYRTH